MIETQRLWLRAFSRDDFAALHGILSDAETMRHYPAPFTEEQTRAWIERNLRRYREDGFGLWAVVEKASGACIGDCGITLQPIHGALLPEIGYHIRRDMQGRGFATEAAAACVRLAFETLGFARVYSYMKYANAASARVAEKNGMRFLEEYEDPVNTRTRVYAIARGEWLARATETAR